MPDCDEERLWHHWFDCPVRADRIPLVANIDGAWCVVQPDWCEGTLIWVLPIPWQKWLDADGRWEMLPHGERHYLLRWVSDGSMSRGSQASQDAREIAYLEEKRKAVLGTRNR